MGMPVPLSNAVESWSEYVEGKVSNVVKAAGFVRFQLRLDGETGRRVVEPRHYIIDFPTREQGRQKHQSALFTLRVVKEEEISRDLTAQGAVANHLRFKPPAERRLIPGADEYVEFELLSREHEVPSQQPLRISMGPVRSNKRSRQQEFVRIDMGQCIQKIATDVIDDRRGGPRMVQNRWWMCIETLRLLCNVDHIDCTALDKVNVPPQEWVIRLMDTHAPINRKEDLKVQHEDRDIDDLMQFIDNRGPGRGANGGTNGISAGSVVKSAKAGKAKKKNNSTEKDEAQADSATSGFAISLPSVGSGNTKKFAGSRGDGKPIGGSSFGDAGSADQDRTNLAEVIASDKAKLGSVEEGGALPPSPTSATARAAAPTGTAVPAPNFQEPATTDAAAPPAAATEPSTLHAKSAPLQDAIDVDLMGELLARYRKLQERSARAEVEAKLTVIRDVLEVLDDLEHADAEVQEDSAASRKLFSVARKFEAKLRGLGLIRVESLGKPFDRQLHRAMGEAPSPEAEASQVVVEELLSGWTMGKELVRPALVSLG